MPGGSNIGYGNIAFSSVIQATLSPGITIPNSVSEQTYTIYGLQVGDVVAASKPTVQSGIGIINARVSAKDTLAIGWMNNTNVTVTPTASELYVITVDRPNVPSATPLPGTFL